MASAPTLSVIVPVYNQERYLAECLDSLLGQTLGDIEVICVDDGSSDASPRMLDEAAARDARVRVVHQANAGVAAARNHGIELARGTYVLFVDSDDFVRTDTCALLRDVAEREQADIVVFGGKTFPVSNWADDCFAKRSQVYTGQSAQALFWEAGSNPLMCNKLYRRSLLVDNALRFNTELRLGEDNAFQFAAFPCAHTIAFTPEILYFYRSHGTSAVQAIQDDHDKRVLEHLKVVRTVVDLWHERGYMAGREHDLLNWAVEFLYRDARFTRLAARRELSCGFGELYARCFAPEVRGRLAKTRADQLDFILDAARAAEEEPRVSVIVAPEPGTAFDEDAFHALETQTEQRFEVLYVPAAGQEDFDAVRRDARCRTVASLAEAVAAARAEWVLVPAASSEYESDAFEQLLDAAQDYRSWAEEANAAHEPGTPVAPRADVLAFTDADGTLEAADVYRYLDITARTVLDGRRVFAAAELGAGAAHFASPVPENKLFATNLVRQVAAGGDGAATSSGAALALRCLLAAQAVLPTRMPLVTLRKPRFQAAPDAPARFVAARADAAAGLGAAVSSAVAASLCSLMDTVRNPDDARLLFGAVKDAVERLCAGDDAAAAGAGPLPEQHAAAIEALRTAQDRDAYLLAHCYELLHRLGMENSKNLAQVGEIATQASLLREDIDRYFTSVTYRAGRLVTALPRKVAALLRRKG